MKRRIGLVIAILLIIVGLLIFTKVVAGIVTPKGKGALQVTSNIAADVLLNGKSVGKAPLCLCEQNQTLASGNYDIKIVPTNSSLEPFSAKVAVNPNVLTAVDRVFLPGALASTSILTLEKTNDKDASVFISSIPDGALVTVDGESQGVTPLLIKSIATSEHEVEIEKSGFGKKTVRIRAVSKFKLVLNVILGAEGNGDESELTPVPSAAPTSATSPTPTQAKILILNTPTGFLRVRATASVAAAEVGRVNPGESFVYASENDSWYQIELANGTQGWVSKQYAQKSTQ